ncbi:MAG: two pore domain potassium channel family protein [Pseudomonadota bacterium]
MKSILETSRRHPSAVLLVVQLLGVLVYPFAENTPGGHIALNIFGLVVLAFTTNMVRTTRGWTWLSILLATAIIVLLTLQMTRDVASLLPWSSGLEAVFYFYAAGSLINYMMSDRNATADELFSAAATFTLIVWGFTHLFVMTQALQPHAFLEPGSGVAPRTWSELNHLSFALLTSTGMGSVIAISAHARALASVEMMVGLMYLAAVVTRLVSFTARPSDETHRRDK